MKNLTLFDIDNTLLKNTRSHRSAFELAIEKVFGIKAELTVINPHGMTDQQILREVMKKNGLDERKIVSGIKKCMKVMEDAFDVLIRDEDLVVLDGVKELLSELEKHHVLKGLVTGNLETIALSKMKKAGLHNFFKLGGYGSDDPNRANLVRIAVRRAVEKYGFTTGSTVYLIGDTPMDIRAGLEAGVVTVGVTTGMYSEQQLHESGAHFVLESFNPADRFLQILGM